MQHGKYHRIEKEKRNLQLYLRQGEEGFSEKVSFVLSLDRWEGGEEGLEKVTKEGKIHPGDYKSLITRYGLEIDKQETKEVGRAVPSSRRVSFSTPIPDLAVNGPSKSPKMRMNMLGFALTRVLGLPCWLSGKESTCQWRRHRFNPWSGKAPHAV